MRPAGQPTRRGLPAPPPTEPELGTEQTSGRSTGQGGDKTAELPTARLCPPDSCGNPSPPGDSRQEVGAGS